MPVIVKLIVFLLVSAGIAYLSRASLLKPRSHGFYRFFAWELILALALLNLDVWFSHPFAWYQCIIRCKSASESEINRPPILKQIGQ